MHEIIVIDSSTDLDELRKALAKATKLRVSVGGGQVSFKVGGGMWSIPMGSLDPECQAAQDIKATQEIDNNSLYRSTLIGEADEPEMCKCGGHYVGAECNGTYDQLAQHFPYIVKWEKRMGAFNYHIVAQLQRAAMDNAPADAIYFQRNMVEHPVGVFNPAGWQTISDIKNPDIISEWGLNEDDRSKHESGQAVS